MRQLLRSFLVFGTGISGLFGQAQVEICAEVGPDLIPIENGDITAGDPGQFFGLVAGGIVDGETPTKRIRYQLKNPGEHLQGACRTDLSIERRAAQRAGVGSGGHVLSFLLRIWRRCYEKTVKRRRYSSSTSSRSSSVLAIPSRKAARKLLRMR